MQNTRHPLSEEMTAHLAKAAEEGYWSHWEHNFKKHRFDWVKSRDMKNLLRSQPEHVNAKAYPSAMKTPGFSW